MPLWLLPDVTKAERCLQPPFTLGGRHGERNACVRSAAAAADGGRCLLPPEGAVGVLR